MIAPASQLPTVDRVERRVVVFVAHGDPQHRERARVEGPPTEEVDPLFRRPSDVPIDRDEQSDEGDRSCALALEHGVAPKARTGFVVSFAKVEARPAHERADFGLGRHAEKMDPANAGREGLS